ncbi:uncharacterized protein LOC109836936 isoform X2 [Asparagus officinalis]|uniref:uncharacterized protein LOC109836936 isoform X1 n=1 Tax=Asparagus officinalis TaxID=4686 RepID=UPI00098DFBDA|nr:uncharacterized protein LOC109836936 isoform X1 [Asparagus officinalis]XP_020260574.1 uncharacterized protein LOC109836936 isoform X2 [Asparagus officinalis]
MRPRQHRPHGGGGAGASSAGAPYSQPSYFPQNPNLQYQSNPQFYQQQSTPQFYFQNPNLQNPLIQNLLNILPQNPNFQSPYIQSQAAPPHRPPQPQNASLNPKVTMERVESAAAKAQRDLATAGENVTAWKVSQATLVSLQVDSWSAVGFQLQEVPTLRRLLATEGKINAFIHCFVGAQRIATVYDLEVAICKNEGIERFEELGMGPLSRHPLVQHYFFVGSDSVDIFKISAEDVIVSLHSFMKHCNRQTVSAEELLDFLAEQKSLPHKQKLGVRIQTLGLHVAYIRLAEKSEKTILSKSLEGSKHKLKERDSTEFPSSAQMHLEKKILNERFDSISNRVKMFSSSSNASGGKHVHFYYSSDDECEDYEDNDNSDNVNSGSHQISSHDNGSSQNCPYPSAAEEMKRLGLKSKTGEKPLKDKLMDVWCRSSRKGQTKGQTKKQKRKRREKHDNTMNKFMRKEEMIDFKKQSNSIIIFDGNIEDFLTTWKEACREHSTAEVLDMMINFYMTSSTERRKKKLHRVFSMLPAAGLLNVAVTCIKRGLLDSIYDTIQIFGDHDSAPSAEIVEINPSIQKSSASNNSKDIDELGYRVTADDIIKNVAEFFRLDVTMPGKRELSFGKIFATLKKLCDCETWLATQYSVKEFSSLGYGNFFSFLEHHASRLPTELHNFLNGKSLEPSRVDASMLQHQLGILLSQAESNLVDTGNISNSDISLVLNKQFPTVSFHIPGDEPEKCFLDLIKRQKDYNNSTCVLYSISLLGKHSIGNLSHFQENLPFRGNWTEVETGQHISFHGNASSKDAIDCLLKVPMLSDLISWSHWDVLYAPSLGPLSDWLLNEVDAKELLCIATVDGKFIRIDQSATVDDFLEAMIQKSPFQVALKLLSILSLYGGVHNSPVTLLKCYVQRAVDVIMTNSTNSMEPRINGEALMHKNTLKEQDTRDKVSAIGIQSIGSKKANKSENICSTLSENLCGINNAVVNVSRFFLECFGYLPSEFRNFGADVLVSGLLSVAKDAHSVILRECSQTSQRLMLHEIGLSLGIAEWIDDFHNFSSTVAADLFISSTTLSRTSCSGSGGTSIHASDKCEKPVSDSYNISDIVADASQEHVNELVTGENVGEIDHTLTNGHGKSQASNGAVNKNYGVAENSVIQDATSIIESIRSEEFGLDPNLNYSDSCMLKKQHARLGRALHCLSQELYSQDSHLLLELVQNADDNNYPEDGDPMLVFILQESGIVVLNNEKGFSAENIRALCDIGNSTKKGSRAGYIGHKGIGFKSVFRVTDAPEIHSNGFHVKFDITDGQIGFVLPTVIPPCNVDMFRQLVLGESHSTADTEWNTCIVLPFRSTIKVTGVASIMSMFSDLHPSLLLFLHRLRCIKFMNMLNKTLVDMRREILGNGIIKVSHGQDTMTWLVISRKLSANLIRSDVQSTEIAVAFTLEDCESGEYKPHLSQQPVFAFLPLRNYGLKFILQGDFVLPSSREEVDGNSAWNQWLLTEFPALFVTAEQSFCSLPCFQQYPGKAVTTFMSFVPVGGEVHGFFSPLPQMIISKLRMSNCLLLDGPDMSWVLPCRVLRGWDEQVRKLVSDSLLQKHLGLGYLSKDIELSDALAKALGVQDYGPKILIDIISSLCCSKDGIMSLGLKWLSAWLGVLHLTLSTFSSGYHSLNSRLQHDMINSLRKVPFVPLSDGSYSSVADGPIWLPCDGSSVGMEDKYSATEFHNLFAKLRTVNPLLLSAANNTYEEAKNDNLVHMLCKIGVQQMSAHEVIKSHILVALSSDKYMGEDRHLMIEYLSFILLHFQYDCARCSSEKKDIISELQKRPVVLTNYGYKCPVDEPVHFGKEYKNPVDIDFFTCNMDNKWLEVDVAYLKHPTTQSLSFGEKKWRSFLQELGVTDFVQVSCIKRNLSDIPYIISGVMMPDEDLTIAASSVNDWESPELLYFLSNFSSRRCREKCIYLLEVLDKMWDDTYNAYSKSFLVSKTNEGKRTIESSFMRSLREFEWVASSTDKKLHRPHDLFYDCNEVRSILGNLAPYAVPQVTSKLLLKDIGLKTEVSVDDALRVLHSWKTSKAPCTASILQMSKFYGFICDGLIKSNVKIDEEFTSSSFIFVPFLSTSRHNDALSGIFLSPKELYWYDPTGCVDKAKELLAFCSSTKDNESVPCKALATIYPCLYDFFVNVCGVPKTPPSGNYLQILLQLSSAARPSQAAHVVFQVFVKWANDLNSGLIKSREILDLKENLLKVENTVLPTLQDKWVSLHPSFGLICWPDDDELKHQFKHYDGIDFLHFGELSKEDEEKLCGRIAALMRDLGVPALSEVVSREAVFYGTHDNRDKASLIKWILPYAQRYIYKLYPDLYLSLKQLGFEKLSQLQVIVADKLFYKNCIKRRGRTSKKRFECCCLLQGSTLYTTLTADSHSIFLELSRFFFDGSTELHFANFLHMVTTMAESGSTSEQTEFFILNSQKVPMLPTEEPEWCFSSLLELPKAEDPQPALASMDVDHNTSTAEKKPGSNSNWPPTGWKNAPDMSYAQANYHLTKPCGPPSLHKDKVSNKALDAIPLTEDVPLPDEINGEWIIEESNTAQTAIGFQDSGWMNNQFNLFSSEPNNELSDPLLVSAPERVRLCYQTNGESQLWKTGRSGEVVAYKYFVNKLGSGNVRWFNEGAETGLPYDMIIGVEGSSREFVEVKTTRYASKDWFEISAREWQFAVERGDSYNIAHVVLGAKKATVTVLKNPLRLCQQNALHLALLMSRQAKDSTVVT